MNREEFWNNKHIKYAQQDWIRTPTIFAQEVVERFPPGAKILDLGAGQGQDTIHFAQRGHPVVAVDFSAFALAQLERLIQAEGIDSVTIVKHDLREKLPFKDGEFDVVYSHLTLHYFSDTDTRRIFQEIARVLRKDGLLCVLVNSTDDPEYGEGAKIEEDYFEYSEGNFKRYFSKDYMHEITKELFIPYILEGKGKTHKDPTEAFIKLIASRI